MKYETTEQINASADELRKIRQEIDELPEIDDEEEPEMILAILREIMKERIKFKVR